MKLITYLQKKNNVTRRDFKAMLDEKVIRINDELVESFSQAVRLDDKITIQLPEGIRDHHVKSLSFQPPKIVLFHKPKGYVVSKDDPHNKTIYELLPDSWHDDFWYIGRLDKDSTGLLLLTNQPSLVNYYENPQNDIHKVYRMRIDRPLKTKDQIKFKKGIEVTDDGFLLEEDPDQPYETLSCVSVRYKQTSKGQYEVIMVLNEGKKRHIRRMFKAFDYKVYDLHRLKVGKRHIGTLKPGKRRIESIKRGPKTKKKKKK